MSHKSMKKKESVFRFRKKGLTVLKVFDTAREKLLICKTTELCVHVDMSLPYGHDDMVYRHLGQTCPCELLVLISIG